VEVAVREDLTSEMVQEMLDGHCSTCTIRGTVRDEFLESLELSRL